MKISFTIATNFNSWVIIALVAITFLYNNINFTQYRMAEKDRGWDKSLTAISKLLDATDSDTDTGGGEESSTDQEKMELDNTVDRQQDEINSSSGPSDTTAGAVEGQVVATSETAPPPPQHAPVVNPPQVSLETPTFRTPLAGESDFQESAASNTPSAGSYRRPIDSQYLANRSNKVKNAEIQGIYRTKRKRHPSPLRRGRR